MVTFWLEISVLFAFDWPFRVARFAEPAPMFIAACELFIARPLFRLPVRLSAVRPANGWLASGADVLFPNDRYRLAASLVDWFRWAPCRAGDWLCSDELRDEPFSVLLSRLLAELLFSVLNGVRCR